MEPQSKPVYQDADGLWWCATDDTQWASEEEALEHLFQLARARRVA